VEGGVRLKGRHTRVASANICAICWLLRGEVGWQRSRCALRKIRVLGSWLEPSHSMHMAGVPGDSVQPSQISGMVDVLSPFSTISAWVCLSVESSSSETLST